MCPANGAHKTSLREASCVHIYDLNDNDESLEGLSLSYQPLIVQ